MLLDLKLLDLEASVNEGSGFEASVFEYSVNVGSGFELFFCNPVRGTNFAFARTLTESSSV